MRCFKRNMKALNLYTHLKTFKTLNLKLEERRQFKNQEIRVVLKGRLYQDSETSKNERQVGLRRKRNPHPQTQTHDSPREGMQWPPDL